MPKHSDPAPLVSIQPAVLVGGRSTRFGRDKLRAPWIGSEGGTWLVDQPRLALRRATGAEIWAVGSCDPAVAARFERHLPDALAGAGPISGIVAALEASGVAALVLSGDLPAINAEDLLRILDAAEQSPTADAVVARATAPADASVEPCVALYRPSILPRLREALTPGKTRGLHRLLAEASIVAVPIDATHLHNANLPSDLVCDDDDAR